MLCPEVWNFPPPKVISSYRKVEKVETVLETIKMNNFYKSIIITCPDEIQTPSLIEELITDDSDYYRISNCSLTELVEPTFIENFVKSGYLYCLSADRNCIRQNCVAITPDGILTLHILEFIYQTLGVEGIKRPHNFYEVKIDLKNQKCINNVKQCLSKLETFDLYISWEPSKEDICPSSIAKYFYDRNMKVTLQTLQIKKIIPPVMEIPSPADVEADEMVEWIGMLAHDGDLSPTETYISTYAQPDSNLALQSTRISILLAKGFLTPNLISNVCRNLANYVSSRELNHFWAGVSVQSHEDSLWKWNFSSPNMFQAHNSSCNVFFTQNNHIMYSIGQLKYS